jgi:anti-sigma factor ChrR (cupin superfamily)
MTSLTDFRKVSNIGNLKWELLEEESMGQVGNTWWHNLSYDDQTGEGSYLYKMDPGTKSKAHLHTGPEEFFLLEGDLIDSDGYHYKKGDFVHLGSGSCHYSSTTLGCTVVVTHRGKFVFTQKGLG